MLGLGTIVTDGYGPKNPEGYGALLQRAADLGVTQLDTAARYGDGESEKLLGRWMTELDLSFSICTKIGIMANQAVGSSGGRSGSPDALMRQAEASLLRLQRDKVEWMLLHRPDPSVPVQRSMEGMIAIREAGLADRIGFSNLDRDDAEALIEAGLTDAIQYSWSLLDHRRQGILETAGRHGVERMVFGTLAFGILAGSVDETTALEPDDWRAIARSGRDPGTNGAPLFIGQAFETAVTKTGAFAARLDAGTSLASATVAAALAVAPAEHVIVGCRTAEELEDLAAGRNRPLPDAVIEQAKALAVI